MAAMAHIRRSGHALGRHIAGYHTLTQVTVSRDLSSAPGSLSPAAAEVLRTRKSVKILDSHMSYLDTEVGDNTVIFLHGNPTSAFLWRNIIPHVKSTARCLAPDLIGMGHSGKPGIMYTFADHYEYLSAWIEEMKVSGKISVVGHDWGSGLGFHWCNQNQQRVQSVVFMESMVGVIPGWDRFPELAKKLFQSFRSEVGEELVLKQNIFVEQLLPGNILRTLAEDEMKEYRAPFLDEKSRLPLLTFPRQIPVKGDGPEDVINVVNDYRSWLHNSAEMPKLYIDADPGLFSAGIRQAVKKWPNLKTVQVKGRHFLQEDSPDDIGNAIRDFLKGIYSQN